MATQVMPPTAAQNVAPTGDLQVQPGSVITPAQGYIIPQTGAHQDTFPPEMYRSQRSRNLGVTLLVVGVLACVMSCIGIILGHHFLVIGHGVWCGILFIVAGKYGMSAADRRRCSIIIFMVLTILSIISAIILLAFSAFGILLALLGTVTIDDMVGIGLCSTQALLAVTAAIVSLWSSVMCCSAVCSSTNTYSAEQQVLILSQLPQQPQQEQQAGDVWKNVPQGSPLSSPPPSSSLSAAGQQQFPQQSSISNTADIKIPVMAPPPAYSEVDLNRSENL